MPFNKDVSDHFYELGLDLLFLGYTKKDIELWIEQAEEDESYEECDGLLRALNYKSNAEDDYYYGEEEEDFI
jgi:hypothetical protein